MHKLSCKTIPMEKPTIYAGQISSREHFVELCNIDGCCFYQQGSSCLSAFWFGSLLIENLFYHQRKYILPSILQYWESYQAKLVQSLKSVEDCVWSGDGRFDSMGHSAKYGVQTMFCCTIMKIVHFELLQVSIRLYKYSIPECDRLPLSSCCCDDIVIMDFVSDNSV